MARKSVTKSKPASKQLVKKYQFAGANSSTYGQVANPYYISGTYSEQAKMEAQRAYDEAIKLGNYAEAENIKIDLARKERETEKKNEAKQFEELKQETAAQNRQEVNQAATDALSSGVDLTKTYLKKRAAEKAAEKTITQAATTVGGTLAANQITAAGAQQVASQVGGVGKVGWSALAASKNAATLANAGTTAAGTTAGTTAGAAAGVGAGAGTAAGGTAANTAASTGASAAGTGASIGAGLATAGVGLGLNIGGTLLEKSGDDNDPTTFTAREKDRNLIGSAMKSAGTGVGIGATIGSFVPIPGVGTVVGGAIGGLVGGGIGLIKGIKENKESKRIADEYKEYEQEQKRIEQERLAAEQKRIAALNEQGRLIANSANRGFIGSRLQGLNTGFGYNTSTNMNTQPTSSFYGKTGGKLPGGHVVPIGDDAVKFIGRKHSEGGIKLDPRTEVEGGETMDKVMMNGGKPNDYFFSAYLKLGGKSFAKRHEELVKAGASQKEIQDLAKKQEAVANKKGEKDRGPEQIAKYGGVHTYKMAGPEASAMAQSNMDAKNVTLRDANKAASSAPSDQQSVAPGKRTNFSGMVTKYQTGFFKIPDQEEEEEELRTDPLTKNITSNNWAGHVKSKTPAPATGLMLIQSAVPGFDEREKAEAEAAAAKPKQTSTKKTSSTTKSTVSSSPSSTTIAKSKPSMGIRGGIDALEQVSKLVNIPKDKSVLSKEDEGGTSMARKDVPKGQHAGKKFYGNVTDMEYAGMVAANPWFDFTNFDPSNKDQVLKFQQEYNKRVKAGDKLQEDGKFGQQTATARLYKDAPAKPADATPGGYKTEVVDPSTMGPFDTTVTAEKEEPEVANLKRGVNGSLLAGLGQLIPVGYALARPYKTDGNLPRMQYAGNVGAGSVRGAILPRVNMNAERAAAERNTVAVKNAIQNTNAGPGGIAAMMAANTAQGNQMLAIANQEQEANKQLAAEEARMGQQASQFNVQTGLEAGKVNVANKLAVDQANLEAGIQEARLKIDEKRYKREEILGALDTAASRIAGIVKDERSYKAQERLAKAIDGTGSYDRFTIYEQLKKESKRKNSPYHGKTDAELRKIASNTYNEFAGKQGGEADETKKMGGRRYTSRLGDLNRGRNKRNFNI